MSDSSTSSSEGNKKKKKMMKKKGKLKMYGKSKKMETDTSKRLE